MTNTTMEKPAVSRRERRARRGGAEGQPDASKVEDTATVTPETATEQPDEPATAAPTGKVEKATEWVMGKFTPNGIVVALRGDHNSIEKASARLNKEAKMRVAFVVDIRAVPPALLVDTKFAAAEEAAMYGLAVDEDEGEGEDE